MPTGDPTCPVCGGWLVNCGGNHKIVTPSCSICGKAGGCQHLPAQPPQVYTLDPIHQGNVTFAPTNHFEFDSYDGSCAPEPDTKPCAECKGTGKIVLFVRAIECDKCKGSGKVLA